MDGIIAGLGRCEGNWGEGGSKSGIEGRMARTGNDGDTMRSMRGRRMWQREGDGR